MTTLRAKRTLAGNIALVIFLAFLTTLTVGVCPGYAVPTDIIDAQVDTTKTVTADSSTALTLTVNIYPLTPGEFGTGALLFRIYNQDTRVYKDIYASQVTNLVYDNGDQDGYQFLYNCNDLDIQNGDTDYQFLVTGWSEGEKTIALTIGVPPDNSSSGGGPSGGTVTPTETETVETTTDSAGTVEAGGTIESTTTDSGEAAVTYTVDSTGVETQLTNEEVTAVEITVPEQVNDTNVAEATVEVPADTLDAIFEAEKPVTVQVAGAALELPVDALDLTALVDRDVDIQIVVNKADAGTTPEPDTAVYEIAGQVYHISIRAVQDGVDKGSISLNKPITLTLPYDKAAVNPDQLKIYRLNEDTNVWECVGGAANTADGTVSVTRSSLSIYTVMAYTGTFTDMTGHWAAGDVQLMAGRGVIKGMTATIFAPDSNVTRAQFAALVLRTLEINENSAAGNVFSDVDADAWYAGAVETASANKLISGYPDGTFKPDASITREEMASIISRALSRSGITSTLSDAEVNAKLAVFNDAAQIADWAKASVAQAVDEGIIKGRTAVESAPKANATRAESAVMLKGFLQSTGIL